MPIPKSVARFNRVATNRLTNLFAGRAPGFGVIVHRGRRSGRTYRTPVMMFRIPHGYVVALTYGPDCDWVRNVRAAGGCDIEVGGRRITAGEPRVVHDPTRHDVPGVVRRALGVLSAADFLYLTEV
jgi:deazaflavin-dependent oxidoreductase (nitroreductase family)